jgi:hypothetical protein
MDLRKTQLTEAEQMSTGMDNHTLSRKGINYDVGTFTRNKNAASSRDEFTPAIVKREMEIIKNDLHCNAIRISGQDLSRLTIAA